MLEFIFGWFNYAVHRLNNSLFFAGIIMLTLNIGARYIELKLDPSTENFLKTALTKEAADLVFHLLMLLADCDVSIADVLAELEARDGVSGLVEKAARTE